MTIGPERSILITGGAGFIGSHVCDALLAMGATVHCLDNFATGDHSNIAHLASHSNFNFIEGDIRSADVCRTAAKGVDQVVHLAALGSVPRSIVDPLATHATNLTGFLNMLEAARGSGVKRFVYASSSSVYGDSLELPKQEDTFGLPLSPYAVTKFTNEIYAGLYDRLHSFPTIGLRFFNVFGERQNPEGPYAAAIPKFLMSFLKDERPQVHGDGRQSRDFTYVGNAVQAVQAALDCDNATCIGKVFNIAYGQRTTILELVALLQSELIKIVPSISKVQLEHVGPRTGDVRDSLADISRARELMGFRPTFTLQQGLQKAVPWYVERFG